MTRLIFSACPDPAERSLTLAYLSQKLMEPFISYSAALSAYFSTVNSRKNFAMETMPNHLHREQSLPRNHHSAGSNKVVEINGCIEMFLSILMVLRLNSLEFFPVIIPPPISKITSLRVVPIGTSIRPTLLILPASANTFVPFDFSVPILLYHSEPFRIIAGILANVSTLLTYLFVPVT